MNCTRCSTVTPTQQNNAKGLCPVCLLKATIAAQAKTIEKLKTYRVYDLKAIRVNLENLLADVKKIEVSAQQSLKGEAEE